MAHVLDVASNRNAWILVLEEGDFKRGEEVGPKESFLFSKLQEGVDAALSATDCAYHPLLHLELPWKDDTSWPEPAAAVIIRLLNYLIRRDGTYLVTIQVPDATGTYVVSRRESPQGHLPVGTFIDECGDTINACVDAEPCMLS